MKEKDEAKMKALLKEAEGHPLMKQILADRRAEVLAKRREIGAQIEDLQKGLDYTDKEAEIDRLVDQLAHLDAERNNLHMAIANNRTFIRSSRHGIEAQVRRLEAEMEESADPAIDEAIEFFNGKLAWLRSDGRISKNAVQGSFNVFTMTKTTTVESNYNAVMGALDYCRTAIQVLQKMKHRPDFDPDIIEKIKAAIPDIGEYTEIVGEKEVTEGISPRHPLILMAEDNEIDWKLEKLAEKFDKVIAKKHRTTPSVPTPPPVAPPPKTGKTVRAFMTGKSL